MSCNLYTNYFGKMSCLFRTPCPELRPYVNLLAIFSTSIENFSGNFIKPFANGSVELFIHTNGSRFQIKTNNSTHTFQHYISGINVSNSQILFAPISSASTYEGYMVSLTYAGVCALLKCKPCELAYSNVSLEHICKHGLNAFISKSNTLNYSHDKLALLEQTLVLQLKSKQLALNTWLLCALNHIKSRNGIIPVENIASVTNTSYRKIHRLFQSELGICPKEYLKILRFNNACRMLSQLPNARWSDIILSCGYYDQAHFIKEFHNQMGQSPQHFLKTTQGFFYLNRPYLIV